MENCPTLPTELAQERESDDALARAGASRDYYRCLGVRTARGAHSLQHQLVGNLLLVEQLELLAVSDFLSRVGEELLAGRNLGSEERVSCIGTGLFGEPSAA